MQASLSHNYLAVANAASLITHGQSRLINTSDPLWLTPSHSFFTTSGDRSPLHSLASIDHLEAPSAFQQHPAITTNTPNSSTLFQEANRNTAK
ncbi:hypothetical protein HBI56_082520 [Parastagonospora nodorum]|nr:hypothetical protein HBH54_126360 [Parastagonospora nodorum]KAH3951334.1 hypothetical protein HBH53_060360 [Parastagonospora nodorum]KAH4025075.1 hypothetical protein HBI13_077140 [Parastagonospora nodorum]KAH4032427.1 hypothetical protein HBI09_118770 [Parastagonospora nodorum]KAH4067709.1 hypothetical protein HBH50_130780 [Parastagonospora nodorum]